MGCDRRAAKRPVNVGLNDDLVREARRFTRNLGGTPEELPGGFVERERARRRDEDRALDRAMDEFGAREHGPLSDDLPSF